MAILCRTDIFLRLGKNVLTVEQKSKSSNSLQLMIGEIVKNCKKIYFLFFDLSIISSEFDERAKQ